LSLELHPPPPRAQPPKPLTDWHTLHAWRTVAASGVVLTGSPKWAVVVAVVCGFGRIRCDRGCLHTSHAVCKNSKHPARKFHLTAASPCLALGRVSAGFCLVFGGGQKGALKENIAQRDQAYCFHQLGGGPPAR
jgi:hypothetical protein